MTCRSSAILTVLLLAALATPSLAQSYLPKTIQFKGATGYSDEELMAATSLKPGTAVTADALNGAVKTLVDTGLFEDVSFEFKDGDLTFTITPSTALKDIVIDNLPLQAGPELDARLRARVPLYHGKAPADGQLIEQLRLALSTEVAAEGVNANIVVLHSYSDDPALHFQQTLPPVHLGAITLTGASPERADEARHVLAKFEDAEYSTQGSPSQIATEVGNYYRQLGYLQVAVEAKLQLPPVTDADGVHLPIQISLKEGPQYHIGKVQLSPELGVTQEDFERRTDVRPGALAQAALLHQAWETLAMDFRNRGYIHAKIVSAATWDSVKALVSYNVSAEPGAQFTMGKLTIENANDELRAAILAEWALPAGAVFNPAKLLGGVDAKAKDPALRRYLAGEALKYAMQVHDETHTVDVTLHLEKNP